MQLDNTTAIILAAGKGTRMGGELPKVLHEVHGKPLIKYLLDTLVSIGVRQPVVVVGHKQEAIRARLRDYDVLFAVQTDQLGTGHAVLAAQSQVTKADRVFIAMGDAPFFRAETFEQLYAALADADVVLSLVTTKRTEQSDRFGRILRNDRDELKTIIEYKDATEAERGITEVNAGCYCVRLPWLWEALQQVEPSTVSGEYYLTDIIRVAISEGKRVVPVQASIDESHGVDTPALLAHANTVTRENDEA